MLHGVCRPALCDARRRLLYTEIRSVKLKASRQVQGAWYGLSAQPSGVRCDRTEINQYTESEREKIEMTEKKPVLAAVGNVWKMFGMFVNFTYFRKICMGRTRGSSAAAVKAADRDVDGATSGEASLTSGGRCDGE